MYIGLLVSPVPYSDNMKPNIVYARAQARADHGLRSCKILDEAFIFNVVNWSSTSPEAQALSKCDLSSVHPTFRSRVAVVIPKRDAFAKQATTWAKAQGLNIFIPDTQCGLDYSNPRGTAAGLD